MKRLPGLAIAAVVVLLLGLSCHRTADVVPLPLPSPEARIVSVTISPDERHVLIRDFDPISRNQSAVLAPVEADGALGSVFRLPAEIDVLGCLTNNSILQPVSGSPAFVEEYSLQGQLLRRVRCPSDRIFGFSSSSDARWWVVAAEEPPALRLWVHSPQDQWIQFEDGASRWAWIPDDGFLYYVRREPRHSHPTRADLYCIRLADMSEPRRLFTNGHWTSYLDLSPGGRYLVGALDVYRTPDGWRPGSLVVLDSKGKLLRQVSKQGGLGRFVDDDLIVFTDHPHGSFPSLDLTRLDLISGSRTVLASDVQSFDVLRQQRRVLAVCEKGRSVWSIAVDNGEKRKVLQVKAGDED